MPGQAPPIQESWSRIAQWLRSHPEATHIADKLLPGVPEAALERLEAAVGMRLPDDLRQFWRLCGGSRPLEAVEQPGGDPWWQPGEWESDIFPRSLPKTMAFSVLSPRAAVDAWRSMKGSDGFARYLLPIATDGGGDYQCLNVSAEPEGGRGQVIEWNHEECIAEVVSPSLTMFLLEIANGLDDGSITYKDGNGLVRVS